MCVCLHELFVPYRGRNPCRAELQVTVSCLMVLLRVELEYLTGAVSVVNYRAVSPALFVCLFVNFCFYFLLGAGRLQGQRPIQRDSGIGVHDVKLTEYREHFVVYTVSHSISLCPYIFTSSVHFNESLVWYEVSGFCDTISTGSSQGLLLDILLLFCVMEILQFWICRTLVFVF